MKNTFLLVAVWALMSTSVFSAEKQILMIAGRPSHPPGQHEHNAGVLLLTKWLNTVPGVHATASLSGAWPSPDQFDKADAIFIFSDGGDAHIAFQEDHAAAIAKAAARGAGLMFMHYATEPPAKRGHEEMTSWASGFFDLNYSINPIWEADIKTFPKHPISSGVKPFKVKDEWYYNIRFAEKPKHFTAILSTIPPASTILADGIRSGNPDVRSKVGQPQIMSWAVERANGGRSVGYTGGHYHANLGDENIRKLLLNSILWVAKAPVPKNGVQVSVTQEELAANLDPKPARRPTSAPKPQ